MRRDIGAWLLAVAAISRLTANVNQCAVLLCSGRLRLRTDAVYMSHPPPNLLHCLNIDVYRLLGGMLRHSICALAFCVPLLRLLFSISV